MDEKNKKYIYLYNVRIQYNKAIKYNDSEVPFLDNA